MAELEIKVDEKKLESKIATNGVSDIIMCTILLMAIMSGFLCGIGAGRIIFWVIMSIEVLLLGSNWVLIMLSSNKSKVEIGVRMLSKARTLRTTYILVSLIFKVPMVIGLTYLFQFTGALFVLLTIFFEEHRVQLVKRAFVNILINAKNINK